jgi:hypothetical protein
MSMFAQLLDKINSAKKEGRLAPIPILNDRFLRNLMRMSRDFHDIVRSVGLNFVCI